MMKFKIRKRLDAFAFALGGASIAASYGAIPVVGNQSIARAWDEKLRKATPEASPQPDSEGRECGQAT